MAFRLPPKRLHVLNTFRAEVGRTLTFDFLVVRGPCLPPHWVTGQVWVTAVLRASLPHQQKKQKQNETKKRVRSSVESGGEKGAVDLEDRRQLCNLGPF